MEYLQELMSTYSTDSDKLSRTVFLFGSSSSVYLSLVGPISVNGGCARDAMWRDTY